MGGVKKTTTFRALCYNEKINQAYRESVCYLELRKYVDDGNVISQVGRFVDMFGGESKSKK